MSILHTTVGNHTRELVRNRNSLAQLHIDEPEAVELGSGD